MKVLKGLFGSKKFLAALGAVIFCVCKELGLDVSDQLVNEVMALTGAYVVGQGIADVGKEKVKEENGVG